MQLGPTSAQESAMAPPAAMSTSTPDANDPPTGEILSFSYSHQAYHRSLILFLLWPCISVAFISYQISRSLSHSIEAQASLLSLVLTLAFRL